MSSLFTLVQVSDLHVGMPCAEDEGPPPGGWPRFDGWLGHSQDALDALTRFVVDRAVTQPTVVAVTGDLTACGKAEEFDFAKRFLTSRFRVGVKPVGLNAADVFSRTIPGNHDHWPGGNTIVGPSRAIGATFAPLPALPMEPWTFPLANGRTLVAYGIDSDADVAPWDRARTLARGSFVTQLKSLRKRIAAGSEAPNELRVLLVHHSPAHAPPHDPRLRIEQKSQDELDSFIRWARVRVLLTGHVHTTAATRALVGDGHHLWSIAEIRCGTTTQISRPPRRWARAGIVAPKQYQPNTLIVHKLTADDDSVVWTAEQFTRRELKFLPDGGVPLHEHGPRARILPRTLPPLRMRFD